MKLSALKKAVKEAEKFCKENNIKDPDCLVDADENGFYNLEELEADTNDDGEVFINLKSSNEI